jgi:hypothetical protein
LLSNENALGVLWYAICVVKGCLILKIKMIRLQSLLHRLFTLFKGLNPVELSLNFANIGKAVGHGLLVFYNFFKSVFIPGVLALLVGVLLLNYFSTNFIRALAG